MTELKTATLVRISQESVFFNSRWERAVNSTVYLRCEDHTIELDLKIAAITNVIVINHDTTTNTIHVGILSKVRLTNRGNEYHISEHAKAIIRAALQAQENPQPGKE